MRNVEVKAMVNNMNKLIVKAKILSNSDGEIINQHDIFFNVPEGRLKLRKFEDRSAELIYYERPDVEGPKISLYEKCTVSSENVDSLYSVLNRALGKKSELKKIRHLFLVGQTRVHIDSVEGLGDFMELEVVLGDKETAEEGEKIAYNLMDKLGVQKENLISGAYTDLLNKIV